MKKRGRNEYPDKILDTDIVFDDLETGIFTDKNSAHKRKKYVKENGKGFREYYF